MHPVLVEHLETFGLAEYQALREQLLDLLSDQDLATAFGGDTLTLGALCRQMGEVEHAYVESLRTFSMNDEFHQQDPRMVSSVAALRGWYAELDRGLMAALEAMSDDDVTNRRIVRSDFDPSDYSPRPTGQLNNYREALLIFYGKASIYLQALGKPFPPQWQSWIG